MNARAVVPQAWVDSTWASVERAIWEVQKELIEDPTPERVQRVRELLLVASMRAQDLAVMVHGTKKEGAGR